MTQSMLVLNKTTYQNLKLRKNLALTEFDMKKSVKKNDHNNRNTNINLIVHIKIEDNMTNYEFQNIA